MEYILVASFHIDRGPIMEHQYPGAISGDEHMLAELMLPDQAHVRNQDWTIFFLHKDTSRDEEGDDASDKAKEPKRRRKHRDVPNESSTKEEGSGSDQEGDYSDGSQDEELEDEELEGGEGPPLIYVLNLVNTKQDTTAKRCAWQPIIPRFRRLMQNRGAIVKAMAVCTRHSFLHIYKACS